MISVGEIFVPECLGPATRADDFIGSHLTGADAPRIIKGMYLTDPQGIRQNIPPTTSESQTIMGALIMPGSVTSQSYL